MSAVAAQHPSIAPAEGAGVWRRDDVREADWLLPFPADALAEVDRLAETLRRNPSTGGCSTMCATRARGSTRGCAVT